MWTRRNLKTKAKQAVKRNYWKTVLVALVFTVVCSGAGTAGAASGTGSNVTHDSTPANYEYVMDQDLNEGLEELEAIDMSDPDNPPVDEVSHTFELMLDGEGDHKEVVGEVLGNPVHIPLSEIFAVTGILTVLLVVVFAISLAVDAFLANPVEVGTARFFTRNLNQPAELGEVTHGFDHNYMQTVKTMFIRDIRTLLWGLLLVIPGVVKAYEYRMIPYLLAEDPTMSRDEAFAQSKRMMDGNKWRAFVLDLSFIGWYLLVIPTFGLINLFFLAPYKKMTDAALYEALRYGQDGPQAGEPLPAPTPVVTSTDSVPVPPFAAQGAPVPTWDDEPTGYDESTDSVVPDGSGA